MLSRKSSMASKVPCLQIACKTTRKRVYRKLLPGAKNAMNEDGRGAYYD